MPVGRLPRAGFIATIEDLDKFENEIRRFNESLARAGKALQNANRRMADLGKGMRKAGAAASEAENQVVGTLERFRHGIIGLGTLRGGVLFRFAKAWGGLMADMAVGAYVINRAFRALTEAIEESIAALEEVERLEVARRTMEVLEGQSRILADRMIMASRKAARFTVDEYDIIAARNRELMAGNVELADSMEKLWDLAYNVAVRTGRGVEQTFAAIVEAIKKGDQAALESAGVFIDVESAVTEFAEAHGLAAEEVDEHTRSLLALRSVVAKTDEYIAELGGTAESSTAELHGIWQELKQIKDIIFSMLGVTISDFLEVRTEDLASLRAALELLREFYSVYLAFRHRRWEELGKRLARATTAVWQFIRPPEEIGLEREKKAHAELTAWTKVQLERRRKLEEAFAKERAKETRAYFREAEQWALRIAEYLPAEQVLQLLDQYYRDLNDILQRVGPHITSFQARLMIKKQVLDKYDRLLDDIREVNRETKRGSSYWKEYNKYLLLSSQTMGQWARAFTIEHGRTPLEAYARHAEPLVAAMVDRLWGEQFARQKGRPPTMEEWRAHWYAYWYPRELWPGGPIRKPTGPLAEEARRLLRTADLEGLGEAFHESWLKSKDLAPSLEKVKTQAEILAEFYEEQGIPALETFVERVQEASKVLGGFVRTREEREEEASRRGRKEGLPFQRGGIVERPGIYYLHPGEMVVPLSDPRRAAAIFIEGMRRGFTLPMAAVRQTNVSLTVNVPVSVHGTSLGSREVETAVARAIESRAGTTLLRAARRLGL